MLACFWWTYSKSSVRIFLIHEAESDSNSPISKWVYNFLWSSNSTILCTSAVFPDPVSPHRLITVGRRWASGKRYHGIRSEITSSTSLSSPIKRLLSAAEISRSLFRFAISSVCMVVFIILFFGHPNNFRIEFSFNVYQQSLAFHYFVNILIGKWRFLRASTNKCNLFRLDNLFKTTHRDGRLRLLS